ncbi:D-amino-acid dehydrogenase [Amycolatopsis xylanica]|uniref:D-amino-acid dehydrogenase n=1 Tax=Amycolatopsis xylanica TaxID=589385 RepID=A0A1H3QVX4_9PSEU|nr:FAD-dependent oxidoreductase [Amycolatopsis xylanica]SDZ17403.1 D-amino-acid dehydrogenase [Amycolatopsis xylanica]
MSVTVVGGGVIGLCAAYYLRQAGARVTVLERGRVGGGASRGNAGEICPDLVAPLPAPGVIGPALRGLPRSDSALYVRPRPDVALARFLVRFGLNTTKHKYDNGVHALAGLARGSFGLFRELESSGVDGDAIKDGFLFAFNSPESARRSWLAQREIGAPLAGQVLGGGELHDLEPALGQAARAGYLVKDQWSVDPSLFVDRLAAVLRADGVEIVEGARATAIQGARVKTSAGDFDAEHVVIAAGIWSRELCRSLGIAVDLFPGKGYSFSVDADPLPRRVVHLGDARVVLTPMGKRLRVAGTMEFDSDVDAFHPRRVAAIVAAAGGYLRSAEWTARRDEWVGARVMTPDGLPAIGPLPGNPRVLLASGHNMLGLMLGPATGRLVNAFVHGTPDPALIQALDPARLSRRAR